MAANKEFQDEEKKEAAKQTRFMLVCPSCGKTVDMKRRYCDCHADLCNANATASANPPEVGRCNFESPNLTCNDCPEDCMYCASFGEPETNRAGFGGQDCRHKKTGTARCNCCQFQVKIGIKLGSVNFLEFVSGVLEKRRAAGKAEEGKNPWLEAADIIRGYMENPILNRISRERERAG
ncbi:MAG: hypothetical protein LBK13_00745 [Spirochaetales bacterium]|jgi:hypothetical protein|nr:hypothetical protein [Spirochaetales bacterium]